MDEQAVQDALKSFCKKYTFQEEKCPTTGRLHFQGRLSLKDKQRLTQLTRTFLNAGITCGAHLEVERDEEKSIQYCLKEESRTRGPWSSDSSYNGSDIVGSALLSPWQKCVVDYVTDPEDPCNREILWIHDPIGGTGKSSLAKYLAFHHGAALYGWVIAKNITHSVAQLKRDPRIFVFDLTRTQPAQFSTGDMYSAIESIKNGVAISSMYESPSKFFKPPHVVVLSNQLPNSAAVSKDRWTVTTLVDEDRMIDKLPPKRRFVMKRIKPN